MLEDYKNALKSGQRAYRACVARGQSPYLAVLDDILVNVNIVSQEPLGLVEIPAESIVGTKTSGRHTAFAPNFMPLLEADTEFAAKWSNLCEAHLEEGIQNPILAYEFMNRFYVQEGNKRVSVLKYYGAVKIAGTVTRLIPARNDSLENRIYYEFLDFYKLSQINYVHFSRTGGYAKLQTLVCKASGESWTEDDRLNFSAFYTVFRQQFIALGGHDLKLTTGDGLLVYLSVYRYADACEATPAQVKENLEKLWTEVKVLTEPQAVELSLEPAPSAGEPLLSKLNIFSSKPSELKVAFLHENNAENSAWVRNHNKGRDALEQAFPDRLTTTTLENVNPEVDAEQALEELAHDSVDVVFTTSARMHTACLKVAAQHPKIRILNCSLNAPHPLVRTYYPRAYEVTYLLGLLAGPRPGWCCGGPACRTRQSRWIFRTARMWTSFTPTAKRSRRAFTGTTACAAGCRTAPWTPWACRCGSGRLFISRSSVPSSTALGAAPAPGLSTTGGGCGAVRRRSTTRRACLAAPCICWI